MSDTLVDFGSLALPDNALDGHDVSLVTYSGKTLDTVLIHGGAAARALSVYATPRSGGWEGSVHHANIAQATAARADEIHCQAGPFGTELTAVLPDRSLLIYTTVTGDRWALRVVTRSSADRKFIETQLTRKLISHSNVKRGDAPWPAGMVLPLTIPRGWAPDTP